MHFTSGQGANRSDSRNYRDDSLHRLGVESAISRFDIYWPEY
jgi:hypothetical protein